VIIELRISVLMLMFRWRGN